MLACVGQGLVIDFQNDPRLEKMYDFADASLRPTAHYHLRPVSRSILAVSNDAHIYFSLAKYIYEFFDILGH